MKLPASTPSPCHGTSPRPPATAAVARQVERDNLNELIAVAEAEHGPVTDEEIQALRDELHRARQQQGPGRTDAA